MPEPIIVLLTGAAGQIAYSLVHTIVRGEVFGRDQPVILHLLDIAPMQGNLGGLVMELNDCAFPLLKKVIATSDEAVAFNNIDVAFMVGAMPRKQGMERKDLLAANTKIFEVSGNSLDKYAKKTVKVLVVGNPANTNAMVMSACAPSIPKENFSALTRLDHNRSIAQIAIRLGVPCNNVQRCIIWGNHSSTQYPDIHHARVKLADGSEKSVIDAVKDDNWLKNDFLKCVQTRGAEVIKARGLSSALSAGKAAADHMKDWWFGTTEWVSMAVMSDGTHYGIPAGIIYSFPVTIADRKWKIVDGLDINQFSRAKMDATAKELAEEKADALAMCKSN